MGGPQATGGTGGVEGVEGVEGVDADEGTQGIDGAVLRYLRAFGPASVKDMQTWAGLTRLREPFERLRPRLAVFQDENGVELFDLPDAPRPDADVPAPPRFLPEFDNLLLSHADRSRVVAPALKGRTWSGNQAHCTLLLDGFLSGLWKLDGAVLTVELFSPAPKALEAEIVAEGEALLATMASQDTASQDLAGAVAGGPTGANGSSSPGTVRFGSIHG